MAKPETDATRGDAYWAVRHIYDNSPGRSWRRLNSALQDALTAAITAHLSFLPDDFRAIRHDMKGSYWMGNSTGSECGERFYSLAVKVGHTPACISFEQYAERPAALWSEDVKTPVRLYIGSRFTWGGRLIDVTNIREDHLIACAYGQRPDDPLEIGCLRYFDHKCRRVYGIVEQEDRILVSFSREEVPDINRKPETIVRITYDDLAAARKAADAIRKNVLKEIEAAADDAALRSVREHITEFGRHGLRPFDIADFSKAIQDKRGNLKGAHNG